MGKRFEKMPQSNTLQKAGRLAVVFFMALKDMLDDYVEQLRIHDSVEQSKQLKCGNSNPPCSPNIKFGCLECTECNWSE